MQPLFKDDFRAINPPKKKKSKLRVKRASDKALRQRSLIELRARFPDLYPADVRAFVLEECGA